MLAAALQSNTGTIGDLVTAIGLRAMADAVMNLTGNQSISGTKNFTGTLQSLGKAVVVTDDARLTNARPPTTHTHVATDVNGLQDNLISMSNATQAAYDLANSKAKSSRAGLDLWFGSQAEFDALPNSQKIANGFVGFVRG